jgi:hypothetical protein
VEHKNQRLALEKLTTLFKTTEADLHYKFNPIKMLFQSILVSAFLATVVIAADQAKQGKCSRTAITSHYPAAYLISVQTRGARMTGSVTGNNADGTEAAAAVGVTAGTATDTEVMGRVTAAAKATTPHSGPLILAL